MRPFIFSTRRVDIERPRPVPPYFRVVELSACVKASKIAPCFLPWDAESGITYRKMECRVVPCLMLRFYTHHHFTLGSEFYGISDEIDHNLPQSGRISSQCVRHLRQHVTGQFQSLLRERACSSTSWCRPGSRADRIRSSRFRSLPASILEKSRMSLMSISSDSAELLTSLEIFALLGGRARCRAPARSCR